MSSGPTDLSLVAWRRAMSAIYADVRSAPDPEHGHALWRVRKDELFRTHPQSPLTVDDPLRATGLPYWPYDPALRFEVAMETPERAETMSVETMSDGLVRLRLAGHVRIPDLGFRLDVWWLAQYAGGIFVPLRDGTARSETYGGGRYLLDTAKGADLGGRAGHLVVDFNFLYHPSCRYNSAWDCPLAPEGNTTTIAVRGGERLV